MLSIPQHVPVVIAALHPQDIERSLDVDRGKVLPASVETPDRLLKQSSDAAQFKDKLLLVGECHTKPSLPLALTPRLSDRRHFTKWNYVLFVANVRQSVPLA